LGSSQEPQGAHAHAEKEPPRAVSGVGDEQTCEAKQNPKKSNWVEKGTLGVLFLTFVAACYAGYEADRLANLTQTLVSDGAEAAATQLRAYVGIVGVDVGSDDNINNGDLHESDAGYVFPDYIKLTLKNFGATTAFDVFDYMTVAAFPYGTGPRDDFIFPDTPATFSLNLPHPIIETGTIDHEQTFVDRHVLRKKDVAAFTAAKAKGNAIYIWGHINICDIYNRKWIRNYAFAYVPWEKPGRQFEPFGHHHQNEYQEGDCQ
jgi:hypothetical protein